MSELEDFADWKNQSNSVNPWLAWQARADLAAEQIEWLEAGLRVAKRRIEELEAGLRVSKRRIEGLEYMLDKIDASRT